MIRALLIDDHPIFRMGLGHYLDGSGSITVVGQADDGISGLRLAEEITWDVAVVDLSLKSLGGLEVIRRLRERFPNRVVVVLSHFPASAFEAQVKREGAAAFVSKAQPPEDLVQIIEARCGRESAFLGRLAERNADGQLPHETLTAREYQVFTCVVAGRSTVETAAELNISASTVSNHLAKIKEKLDAPTVAAIVIYAVRAGLVE